MHDDEIRSAFLEFRRDGSGAALARVFDAVAPELLLVAYHLGASAHDAEDLVQSTFVVAMRAADSYDATRSLRRWLFGILANQHRNARRKAERAPASDRLRPREATDPPAAAIAQEFRDALQAALSGLPEVYRRVLVLRLVHGMTEAEIAHAFGRPPGTIKTWVHRGMKLLRRALPAAFAGSLAGLVSSGRGLAATRAAVLAEHQRFVASTAAKAAPAMAASGAMLWVAGGLLAAVVAVTSWSLWVPESDTPVGRGTTRDAAPARAPAGAVEAGTDVSVSRAPVREEVAAAGLRVHVMRAVDHMAEAGIVVLARPVDGANPELRERRAITDGHGVATFANDPTSGSWCVRLDRARTATVVETATDARTDVTLELPPAVHVTGRVVDAGRRPLAGASVWLTSAERFDVGVVVARTDEQGRFTLDDVAQGRAVAALAPGLLPSALQPTTPIAGASECDVEIVLDAPARSVAGRVQGPDGEPIAGAVVGFGLQFERPRDTGACSDGVSRPPIVTHTGDDGAFACGSVGVELPTRVWVRAPGYAPWGGWTRPGDDRPLTIRLTRGGRLEGRVRDAVGRPRAGARVAIVHAAFARRRGEDRGPEWLDSVGVCDADGAFAIDGLPAGALRAAVHGGECTATTTRVVHDGETLRWNVVLSPSRPWTARLVDERGRPLAAWRVVARGTLGLPDWPAVTTDADGRFTLAPADASQCALSVFQPDSAIAGEPARTWPPAAERQSCDLVVADARIASGYLTGSVHDAGGTRCDLGAVVAGFGRRVPVTIEPGGGRFRVGPLPPGEYRVAVYDPAEREAMAWSKPVTLAARATVDCGDLRTVPAGSFEIELFDRAGAKVAFGLVHAVREGDDAPGETVVVRDGIGASGPVRPGRYALSWSAAGAGAVLGAEVDVPAGDEAPSHAVLRARPAQLVEVTFDADATSERPGAVDVTLLDGAARVLARFVTARSAGSAAEAKLRLLLPPGDYRVAARDDHGRRGTAPLSVPADGDARAVLRVPVELRR